MRDNEPSCSNLTPPDSVMDEYSGVVKKYIRIFFAASFTFFKYNRRHLFFLACGLLLLFTETAFAYFFEINKKEGTVMIPSKKQIFI